MFSHVEQALEHLNTALDEVEVAPSELLRRTLGLSKQLRSRVELLETKAAALVAQRERHGDGGAGLLHQHSGLSRSDAARNVRTDTELASLPDAHAAVSEGHISLANAAKLAQAARKTSPDAVQGDPELVGLAKTELGSACPLTNSPKPPSAGRPATKTLLIWLRSIAATGATAMCVFGTATTARCRCAVHSTPRLAPAFKTGCVAKQSSSVKQIVVDKPSLNPNVNPVATTTTAMMLPRAPTTSAWQTRSTRSSPPLPGPAPTPRRHGRRPKASVKAPLQRSSCAQIWRP